MTDAGDSDEFAVFFEDVEPKLRRALAAAYGPEVGREAAADALVYGWQNWERVSAMTNPAGYLYRVGQSKARKYRLLPRRLPASGNRDDPPWVEPALDDAMKSLTLRQRQCVVMVHAMGLDSDEVADLLGIGTNSVRTHLERGLERLRKALKVNHGTQERPA